MFSDETNCSGVHAYGFIAAFFTVKAVVELLGVMRVRSGCVSLPEW